MTGSTPLWPGRVPEADEEGMMVVPRVPLDNQDKGLDDTLVAMKTSDCHPSNKTGARLELMQP